jgi:hypothetical protein
MVSMRSTRLAVLAVAVGSALLGWSTAGVGAVADNLAKSTAPAPAVGHDHHDHDAHHGEPGV